jgi:hypothetical protein
VQRDDAVGILTNIADKMSVDVSHIDRRTHRRPRSRPGIANAKFDISSLEAVRVATRLSASHRGYTFRASTSIKPESRRLPRPLPQDIERPMKQHSSSRIEWPLAARNRLLSVRRMVPTNDPSWPVTACRRSAARDPCATATICARAAGLRAEPDIQRLLTGSAYRLATFLRPR